MMNWIRPVVSTFGGWWSTMSGAISIPFAILALFLPSTTGKTLFAALAYVSLLATAITMAVNHQKQSDEIQKLKNELDEIKVAVTGHVVVQNTDRLRILLQVSAVNLGRRSVRIGKAAAILTKTSLRPPPGLSPEKAEAFAKLNETNLTSHELLLFERPGQNAIELSPDGGAHDWETPIPHGLEFLSENHGGEKCGKGYLMLTSGKKLEFTFPLLDKWPPIGN